MENNQKTWKEIFEDYKRAANKPSAYDPRYDNLKVKYNMLSDEANTKETILLGTLSTDHIKLSRRGIKVILYDKCVWDTGIFSTSSIRDSVYEGIERTKIAVSCILTKEIGTFTMNRAKSLYEYDESYRNYYSDNNVVTLSVLSTLVKESEEIVNKIDDNFITKAKEVYREIEGIVKNINRFNSSIEKRTRSADDLRYEVVNRWWRDEALTKGTKLAVTTPTGRYSYTGEVDHTAKGKDDVIIHFTDGRKVHKSRINVQVSFDTNNRRTDKVWGSILDLNL